MGTRSGELRRRAAPLFMEDNSFSIGLAPQYAFNMESKSVHRNFKLFTGSVESTHAENKKNDWLFTLGINYRFKI
ncbi:hypothetical protein [Allomuricauda sp. F6463D]|uniref:hypothetical protein n=1 Tax=Allomuricauda sp. F6463D TaxID=2926409 RepID=UPI001FF21CA2|nr:hypothetical protein [Muricauda sp. F6463D]MCK0160040.1 hypothetical protein [Muricauda sp. F6463D]